MVACPNSWIQSGDVGIRLLLLASGILHEEHPLTATLHTKAIVQHLYHSSHNSNLVTFVTRQAHLGIVAELEKT
jgi:hypothetical protein